jgi:hypothetical protein
MNFLQMLCCALAIKSSDLIDGYNSVIGARQLRGTRRMQTFEETNAFLKSAAEEITDTGKNICMCASETPAPVSESVIDERRLRSWNQRSVKGRVLVNQHTTKQTKEVTNTP